jgi:hypothetical protein
VLRAERPAVLEVQVHPPDIRRGVRYLFFGRRELLLLAVGASLLA